MKVAFISEPAGKICRGLKDFCLKNFLPSQVTELAAAKFGSAL